MTTQLRCVIYGAIFVYVIGAILIGVGKGLRGPAAPPAPRAETKTIRRKHRLGDNVELRGGKVVQFCDKCGNWIEAVWHG